MKTSELQTEKCSKWEISLKTLAQQGIADIHGYVSTEFGDPCFKLRRILFDDGSFVDVEGEHDIPYIVAYDEPAKSLRLDYESLEKIED
jgi:hypothetical protein